MSSDPGSSDPGTAAEAALIRRAQQGDVGAFTDLYRQHSRWVFGVSLRLVGNVGDAEDATQDTFVQVWKSLPWFRHESELRTWIHRICVNRCFRSNTRRTARRTEQLPENLISTDPDPAEVAEMGSQMAEVQEAIADLPAGQRSALVLREYGGLSYEEVAQTLDITLTAARTRIHRARLKVVSRLELRPGHADDRPNPAVGRDHGPVDASTGELFRSDLGSSTGASPHAPDRTGSGGEDDRPAVRHLKEARA